MSSILNRKWNWTLVAKKDGVAVEDANVFVWEDTSATTVIDTVTDAGGTITTSVTEAIYTITNTDDVATEDKTPHTISCCKYGLIPIGLELAFLADRLDTFFMKVNNYITEDDSATTAAYTGIDIDHTNGVITITEEHSVDDLYDYCQYDMTQSPLKDHPHGILTTINGSDYVLVYDLTIDGVNVAGAGKFIDMHNNTLTLSNSAGTSAKIQDINGMLVTFSLTGLQENSEIRVYKKSDMNEEAGIENSGVSFTYNYNWSEDVDVIVVIYGVGYDPIRLELTLTSSDNSIPIQQRKDRWYKNPS